MHKYLHIITDTERLRDPDGQEFDDLAEAIAEATQSARDLMAEELRAGRPLPLGWRVQVAEPDETIVATLGFAEIALGANTRTTLRPQPLLDPKLLDRAKETFHKARAGQRKLQAGVQRLQENVRILAQLSDAMFTNLSKPRRKGPA